MTKQELTARQFVEGIRDGAPTARLAILRFQQKWALIQPKRRADNAQRHADWYCSLPWYGRWWVMVRGK